jgi:acid phosphatase
MEHDGFSRHETAHAGEAGGAPRAAKPLTFLAVGDWGRAGDANQRAVAVGMGRTASQLGSRFVVSLGDNLYENGVQSVDDPLWRTAYEEVYTAPSLQTPWYALLGNHDYNGEPQAQLDYARLSPRWRMPARYYVLEGAGFGAPWVDLVFIDTSPLIQAYRERIDGPLKTHVLAQDAKAQLAWLDAALGRSRARWKLVFGHHVLYSGGSGHGTDDDLLRRLKPMFDRHGVTAYVCGHEHDLQHIKVGGMDYICSGAGSEVRPTGAVRGTRFAEAQPGFAAFAVGRDALALSFHDARGERLYAADLAPAHAA